ncbi:hypothetical protein N177_3393 [Lutibaculum baratangense AMV1]|uniref:Uncharacterized protein n=1 Tax=Lutibaculum baratangense AMV1 TaxID=631454 RepID=V4RJ78_9HYPH|nr:hypothetical protein N177_3393 [Lutibaculum baratangense AMV1]
MQAIAEAIGQLPVHVYERGEDGAWHAAFGKSIHELAV